MGLGCGGDSRLGQARGDTTASVRLIRSALGAGVNFIDTAEAYGTEEVVGRALRNFPRDQVVLSTKKTTFAVCSGETPSRLDRASILDAPGVATR